jgi:hypothetical protein
MKKTLSQVTSLALLLIAILFSNSCHKTDLPCADPRNGNTDFRQCVIQKIGDGLESPFARRLTITYNSRRDPVTAEPTYVGTGSPRWVFYYDKKGRLITYAGLYDNGAFEFWHNYHYDHLDRIVSDTNYGFGPIGQLDQAYGWRHAQITYDRLNRVISQSLTSSHPIIDPPYTATFTYNAAGNLGTNNANYDDKVNPLLTNKIWRFLARDYSVNNYGTATTYNEKGLPLHFSGDILAFSYDSFWQIYASPITIEYDCHDDPHGGHY